jgi:uncharacterized protein YqeY
MSLKEQINSDIKKAMLSKNTDDLRALRAIKSMILIAETEKGSSGSLSPESEMKLLQKAVKQRKDSMAIYVEKGREDLAETEGAEVAVIERYLPKQMTEDEIIDALREIVRESGASSMKDMGKVMGLATKRMAGRADNKLISLQVKNLLSGE